MRAWQVWSLQIFCSMICLKASNGLEPWRSDGNRVRDQRNPLLLGQTPLWCRFSRYLGRRWGGCGVAWWEGKVRRGHWVYKRDVYSSVSTHKTKSRGNEEVHPVWVGIKLMFGECSNLKCLHSLENKNSPEYIVMAREGRLITANYLFVKLRDSHTWTRGLSHQ